MSDLSLRDDLVQRLHKIAQREHRHIDEVVESLLKQYDPFSDIEAEQDDELRQDRLRIYDRARHYWQQINDERQYMSNEELDQEFWFIDPEGIPRLKAEQSEVTLPADAFEQILNMAEADRSISWHTEADNSGETKTILNREYTDHLLSRLNRPSIHDEQ